MPPWFKAHHAAIDAIVAAGVTFGLFWFFGALHWPGMFALYGGVFGAFQLLRFVNATLERPR